MKVDYTPLPNPNQKRFLGPGPLIYGCVWGPDGHREEPSVTLMLPDKGPDRNTTLESLLFIVRNGQKGSRAV